MTAQHGLDRKARLAVTTVVLLLLLIVAVGIRGCVGAMMPKSIIAQAAPGDDQIVQIGKQTILLEQGSVASKISEWLDGGASEPRAFTIDDQLFQADSDALTQEGMLRLQRFVDLVKDNALDAKLFVTTYEGTDAAQKQQLAARRAERVRSEMIARGVSGAQISTAVQHISTGATAARTAPVTMALVLSKDGSQTADKVQGLA